MSEIHDLLQNEILKNQLIMASLIVCCIYPLKAECDEYIRMFEYIGLKYLFGHSFGSILFVPIYLDIRWGKICLNEYIQTFVHECVRE